MYASPGFVVLFSACVGACASTSEEVVSTSTRGDAGPRASTRPPFDSSVYGDGAPWNDPSRISIEQLVVGAVLNPDGTIASDIDVPDSYEPLEGVKVCWQGPDYQVCAHSGADGWYALGGLPKDQEIVLTADKDGYGPVAQPLITGRTNATSGGFSRMVLMPLEARASLLPPGVAWSDDHGAISFASSGLVNGQVRFIGGHRVTLEAPEYDGPIYLDDWVPIPDATASFAHLGNFWNVPEGQWLLTYEHPRLGCEYAGRALGSNQLIIWGFPTTTLNVIRVPVLAGRTTSPINATCLERLADAGSDGAAQ